MVRSRSIAAPASGEMDQFSLKDLDEIDLLLAELEISQGRGNLILCSVASPAYRDKLILAIDDRFATKNFFIENGDQLISDLRRLKDAEERVIIWIFPETLSKDILDALNNFRELFYESGVPNLIFLAPSALDDVILTAPDLWRYRGGFHKFEGKDGGPSFQAVEALSMPVSLSYQSKEELLRRKRINEYLLEKMKDKRSQANSMAELGTIHLLLGEPRKAIEFYEQALKISCEIGDRQGEGNRLGNLGLAYYHLGEPRKAIEYYDQALKISREIGDRQGEGNRLGNLGLAYYHLGEPRKAIEYYDQALKISREIRDKRGEGADLGNLGNAYYHLDEPRKAIEYYDQALKISRDIGDRRGEGNQLGNLGLAYSHLGEPRKAIEYYDQALKISRDIGDRRGEGNHLGNLGNAYYHLDEPRKAIEYYDQALKISREIGDRRGEGNRLGNLGLAFYGLGQRDKAIEYIKAALAIFEKIESPYAEQARKMLARWQEDEKPA
jgi:tetratricopeptide (TPR) repeat protein